MTCRKNILIWTAGILMLPAGCLAWLTAAPANFSVKVKPESIEMGAFYHGVPLRIEGVVNAGSKVVAVIRGPDVEEVFNVKGRVGPIWINSGKVHISGVPSLLLSFSASPLNGLLRSDELARFQLGETAVRTQMRVEPQQNNEAIVRSNFLALKAREGVYRFEAKGVKMGSPRGSVVPYTVRFWWPKKAPPAMYEVRVYECRGGVVVGQTAVPLKVVEVGFPALLSSLAGNQPALYGVLAVAIAMLTGFGIDFLAARLWRKKEPVQDHAPPEEVPTVEHAALAPDGVEQKSSHRARSTA